MKGLDVMQRWPEMYVPENNRSGAIAARLASDALMLGATRVQADRAGMWSVVSADIDWLVLPASIEVCPADLFHRLVPFPEGGRREVRAEAWVGAYSQVAYVVSADARLRVVGEAALPVEVEEMLLPPGCVRSVAFSVVENS